MWIVAINPHAAHGKGLERGKSLMQLLDRREVRYVKVIGDSPQDLQRQLENLLDAGNYQGVFSVGGDGLAHLIFQVCIPRHVPFAIIPAGTGNDFVRTLGWSLDSYEAFIDQVLTTQAQPIDMGVVDSEWFGAILSTGFDSIVNERANTLKWPKGPSRYNVAIATELPKFKPRSYVIETETSKFETEAMLIAVGNGRSYGGGMNVCPQAQLHDGLFDLVILEPVSTFEFLRTFPKVYSGTHITHPRVKSLRAKKVSITADAIAYADGERIGPAPISAECVANAGLTWIL